MIKLEKYYRNLGVVTMKRSNAVQYFNNLYESTFDDAKAFVVGLTGNTDIVENVLLKTYKSVFEKLLKQKDITSDDIGKFFYNTLKNNALELAGTTQNTAYLPNEKQADDLKQILNTEFDLDEQKVNDEFLIKKAHNFLSQKPSIQKKAFVLYFYEGYETGEISKMLAVDEQVINGYIFDVLEDIKNNFLNGYLVQK